MNSRQSFNSKCLRGLVSVILGAAVANSVAHGAAAKPPVIVINRGYRLLIASEKGSIASFRSTFGVDRELLIPSHAGLPLFKIEFLNDRSEFKTVTSSEAKDRSACRTLDCVSVFALTVDDAMTALKAIAGADDADPCLRHARWA